MSDSCEAVECSTPLGITASLGHRRGRRSCAGEPCSTPLGITASLGPRAQFEEAHKDVLNASRHHRVARG